MSRVKAVYRPARAARRACNIVVVGCSTSAPGSAWVEEFTTNQNALGDTVVNVAVGGIDLKQYFLNTTQFATSVTANKSGSLRNIILCYEGNYADFNYGDFVDGASSPGHGFTSGEQAWPIYAEFSNRCRFGGGGYGSGGWEVFMSTLEPWDDGEQPQPGYKNYLKQLNAMCRSRAGIDFDRLLDLDGTNHWDPFGNANNWYDGSGVHKTAAGYTQMAADFTALFAAAV